MWVCSGKNSDSCPRSSASLATSPGLIASCVGKIATPNSICTILPHRQLVFPPGFWHTPPPPASRSAVIVGHRGQGHPKPSRLAPYVRVCRPARSVVFMIAGHLGRISPILTHSHAGSTKLRTVCSILPGGLHAVAVFLPLLTLDHAGGSVLPGR